jgi:thiol-disulfide isomerase/thioredoxin
MPEFTVKRLGSPQTIRSQGLKTPYLMNVWASWCPPCREEFPLLTNALESGNLPFALYFLNTGDTQRAANNFLRTQRTGLELLFDAPPDYSFYELLGVKAIPVTFLVGQDNVVQAIHVGGLIPETLEFFKLIAESPGVGSLNIEGAVPPAKPFNLNNPIRLHAGLPHFGVLEDRRPYQVYTIEGSADSLLTVSMRQLYTDDDVNAVDPYLVLLNEAGEVIAFDDDGGKFTSGATGRNREDLAGSEQDALITQFLLPATGRYYLIAARAGYEEGRNAGKYQITLVDEAAFF